MPRDIHITRIITRTSEVALQLRRLSFSGFQPADERWAPAVNALRFDDCIEICVDLAGVDREHVQLSIEDRCLHIRGTRPALDADCREQSGCRILMMEIDDGPFERILPLPKDADLDSSQVSARQQQGFLWITIPLRS